MSEPIRITRRIKGEPGVLIDKARELAGKNGITIAGDDRKGTVKGSFFLPLKGEYYITGGVFTATISQWPWYLKRQDVEKELRSWLDENDKR